MSQLRFSLNRDPPTCRIEVNKLLSHHHILVIVEGWSDRSAACGGTYKESRLFTIIELKLRILILTKRV